MDNVFFIASKLFWALVEPGALLALLLGAGVSALWFGRTRLGRGLVSTGLAALVAIGFFPLGDALLPPLEGAHPPEPTVAAPVVGVVVLGGAEDPAAFTRWGEPAANHAGERFLGAVALALRHSEARVLLTGGSAALTGRSGAPVEARIAESFLVAAGVSPERILREERSRNTAENAAFSRELVRALGLPEEGPWLLVTSAFHMPRAVETFCAAGWRGVIPWPVDYRSGVIDWTPRWDLAGRLERLGLAVKEWIGRLAYRLTGRAARLPPKCLA